MRSRVLQVVIGLLAFGAQTMAALADEPEDSDRLILISIPHRQLALISHGQVVKIYETAVGTESTPSPTGRHVIMNRVPNPTYYTPGKVVRPGRANPLGTRWMGLSKKGFGIHGTNVPSSIGKAASHGCIRMHNRDAEDLFEKVQVGDSVEICDQTDERLAGIFGELGSSAPKPAGTMPAPEPTKDLNPGLVIAMGVTR